MYGSHSNNHHHHHHYPNSHHRAPQAAAASSPEGALAADIFEKFIAASTLKSVLHHYRNICDVLKLRPTNFKNFYPKLRHKIRSWKAQQLWTKFDKRAAHKCYNHGTAAINSKVLIIGAGPCGLRTAIEAQLLGAKVVVVEKRDRFSRNNVLHLWPFVITDLKALGAKKFYGKFCAGAIDHISIRQLQCILLKVALLLGVEVIEAVAFEQLLDPPDDQNQRVGWHARFSPADHPVNQYEFDVLVGADGKRNTLSGFKRKEFRGKLAIAITANFINRRTEQEASVQEISGVAFIFNQKFFRDLYAETGIDLENIVYYKDETHYFVMTAKKHSLINKGVILRDLPDTQELLHPKNVDRAALCAYAREAADFSTNYHLPHTDFAVNHYGKPDIAMFDFTSMFAAENACKVLVKNGHKLLQCLVGDSLLEPFWPTGSGCARGFLSSFDACWAIRSWSSGTMTTSEVVAERESIYRLLAQTTPENLAKDITAYTLEPQSRYPTINLRCVMPFQVRHLVDMDDSVGGDEPVHRPPSQEHGGPRKKLKTESTVHPEKLLKWCQKELEQHPELPIEDLHSSFKDGRALCAIIHRYYPYMVDYSSLSHENVEENNQLAFDILETEFNIPPVMTGEEMASCEQPDQYQMISYISQIHNVFRGKIPQLMVPRKSDKSFDFDDFPVPLDMETNQPRALGRPETSKSEGNLLQCKILTGSKENINPLDPHKATKRRNESGSLDKLNEVSKKAAPVNTEEFNDKVKDLEAKFRNPASSKQKPKDMIRAIGKLDKNDWNLAAIEQKMKDSKRTQVSQDTEKVPKWSRDAYYDKQQNIERRLRDSGEDEQRIAKYLDIDASLKRLERKLKEGSTLETGLRGHNKVSNLASQLSSKFVPKKDDTTALNRQRRPMVMSTSSCDMCQLCNKRVYLAERISAEGKFFHRTCFKCCHCSALLRLGHYIYDREGRYGGQYFCIPHFGMSAKTGLKTVEMPSLVNYHNKVPEPKTPEKAAVISPKTDKEGLNLLNPGLASMEDRGTTPERAEFENSVIEESDEDEYLSEDEWTDRNFGASANELDDSEEESSEMSDEEVGPDDYDSEFKISADETRRLAETWKRRFSTDSLDSDVSKEENLHSDSDHFTEEHGADGDESHTATEGEDEIDDEEQDALKRAREIRRQELNINFKAPTEDTQSSDSGSETEMASDDEESATQIDTDSEFADDNAQNMPKDIPKILINEGEDESADPKSEYIDQIIELDDAPNFKFEGPNPRTEQLKRLLQRTESTEAVTAKWNPQAMQSNLRGNMASLPKKSASSADLGNRFQSFMEKISATQKKLNPAPEPSPAMQAFLSASSKHSSTPYAPTTPDISNKDSTTPVITPDSILKEEKSNPQQIPNEEIPEVPSVMNMSVDENFQESGTPEIKVDEPIFFAKNDPVIDTFSNGEHDHIEAVNPLIESNPRELTNHLNNSTPYSANASICDSDIDVIFDKLAGQAMDDLQNVSNNSVSLSTILRDSEPNFVTDTNCNVEPEDNSSTPNIIEKLEIIEKDEATEETQNNNDLVSTSCKEDSEDEMLHDWAENYVMEGAAEDYLLTASPQKKVALASTEVLTPEQEIPPVIEDNTSKNTLELDNIEFMDTSASESSDVQSQFSYEKLDERPVEPLTQSLPISPIPKEISSHDTTRSDVEISTNEINSKTETTEDSSLNVNSPSTSITPKRYEGYIPRFKDRVTPFRYVRDSIDVRKSTSSKPLFTPSKEDIAERQKNQLNLSKSITSPCIPMTEPKKICTSTPKPTDKDLVRDMVLSRITKKHKRRGSKGSLKSLNSSDSSTPTSEVKSPMFQPSPLSLSMSTSDILSNSDFGTPITSRSLSELKLQNVPKPETSTPINRSNLPATPMTHPEKFYTPTVPSPIYKNPLNQEDSLEYNVLEEDSHLLNRNVSKRLYTEASSKDRCRRSSESEVKSLNHVTTAQPSRKVDPPKMRESKDVRLKKLLAEHRRKELEGSKDSRDKDIDSCIRECLEEYRQKRFSEPIPQNLNFGLEKTSSDVVDSTIVSRTDKPVSEWRAFSPLEPAESPVVPLGVNAPMANSEGVKPPEMRKVKKSKDKERRRSLIQVVAGLFNKSDEQKKETSPEKRQSRSPSLSPSPDSLSPKSPTVKERFSKLRISRSKDKHKNKESRSQSAEPTVTNSSAQGISLPTSPSRTIFSFLSSKNAERPTPNPSGHISSEGPSSHPNKPVISRIQEENVSDIENVATLDVSSEKDSSLLQTPSARRQKAALRAAKQAEHKRHRVAQEIQRQLEECEVKAKELEAKGIRVEKALRGELDGNSSNEQELMTMWFELVHEKNALKRWEQELTVKAKEVQLEDQHRRLENELRQRMGCLESEKSRDDIDREGAILNQMLEILDQKDSLVALLEEDRMRFESLYPSCEIPECSSTIGDKPEHALDDPYNDPSFSIDMLKNYEYQPINTKWKDELGKLKLDLEFVDSDDVSNFREKHKPVLRKTKGFKKSYSINVILMVIGTVLWVLFIINLPYLMCDFIEIKSYSEGDVY